MIDVNLFGCAETFKDFLNNIFTVSVSFSWKILGLYFFLIACIILQFPVRFDVDDSENFERRR